MGSFSLFQTITRTRNKHAHTTHINTVEYLEPNRSKIQIQNENE